MIINTFFIRMAIGIITVFLLITTAGFAAFPERPIQVLVGWPVGSQSDILNRSLTKPLAKTLKQPVIIQNVPGGAGALVLGRVKSEKPDGYTLFQTTLPIYSQTPWTRVVPYDPLKDFAYLAQLARGGHYLLCRSDSPWKTFEELIQYVKTNPKKVLYATTGVGSTPHILMEYLAMKENMQWIHVPCNDINEAVTALLGGHVTLAPVALATELEYVKAGRLHALICLNEKRIPLLPDLSTVREKGYDFSVETSFIWTVPANTPKNIKLVLEKALLQAFADTEVGECINKLNKTYDPLGSEALTKAVIKDHQQYGELMKKFGLGIFKK